MWICARCGTEAQKPEVCSGCGSSMKPFDPPPKEERFQFCLLTYPPGKTKATEFIGPFPSVMAADQWWEQHMAPHGYHFNDYEVLLMENPNERET